MTPFEIAMSIRDRQDISEDIAAFAMRTMPNERVADLDSALVLLIGWERVVEEMSDLLDALKTAPAGSLGQMIADVIAAKRKLGYDHKLEAILARRWRCPHCKQFATILSVELPIGKPERLPRCHICGEEGVAPLETVADLDVRDGGKSGLRPTD